MEKYFDIKLGIFIGVILASVIIGILVNIDESSRPSAIDVYRGKTTLEITYKDGVPIDSVVVFK